MTTSGRLDLVAGLAHLFSPWTGKFGRETLDLWLAAELGDAAILDDARPHGPLRSRCLAPERILHVISENTPHAGMQSLLRGLVIGSRNTLKLPSGGLTVVEEAVAALPPGLAGLVELAPDLPPGWTREFDLVVVFGTDETTSWFRQNTPEHLPLILHGQRLGIGLVLGDPEAAAERAARDVSLFDQRGCLSIHAVYVSPSAAVSFHEFAGMLADEMDSYDQLHPRGPLGPSEAGAITNLRETARFLAANEPEDHGLWESPGSTHWTVVAERDPTLKPSCLNRVVHVKPWPREAGSGALGPECRHLSAIALHPFPPDPPPDLLRLGASRLCPLGAAQDPSLFWHHDGIPPLASLVRWVDLG
jgi:hypothetical protein